MSPSTTPEELAEDFATFFLQEINKIQEQFKTIPTYRPTLTDVLKFTNFL